MDAEMPLPPPSSSPSSSTSSTPREVRVKVEVGGEDRPIDVDDSSSSQSSPSSAQLAQHAKNVLSEQATKFAIKHFYCSITLDVMIDPVIASCGNIFERYAITDWIERNHNSPVTREPLTLAGLTGIRSLKNQIEEYFTSDDCNSEMKEEYIEAKNKPKKLYDEGKILEAANIGYVLAMGEMAKNFRFGKNGYVKDAAKAFKWATKAANANDKKGQYELGYCYDEGIGVARDHVAALKWYELAGDAKSFNSMGHIYYMGEYGVDEDFTKAVEYYRKAADLGSAYAQYCLANMYYDREGVEQSFTEARRFFKLSADQDNAMAQYRLGVMMMKGEGGEKNMEGLVLIDKSAKQGFEEAKARLAKIEESLNN